MCAHLAFLLPADFLAVFLADDFLADLLGAAFWGVAWAEPATGAWAGAAGVVFLTGLLATFLVPFFEILFEAPAFLVTLLVTFLAPVGLVLAK